MEIFTVLSSVGTFVMAFIYLVSVSIQLYQMRINFVPALGISQTFLIKGNDTSNQMKIRNISGQADKDHIILHNMGGGAAKEVYISIYLHERDAYLKEKDAIQKKYVPMIPSKENYLLPVNYTIYNELRNTIENDARETNLTIKIDYKHNLNNKWHTIYKNAEVNIFNEYSEEEIYELQFM